MLDGFSGKYVKIFIDGVPQEGVGSSFGIKDGIEVYLDESLKRFETVYPAAGDDHSAVRLTIPELEEVSGAKGWVDVCREPEDQQRE